MLHRGCILPHAFTAVLALAGCGLEPNPIGLLLPPVNVSELSTQIFQFTPPDLSSLTPLEKAALDAIWVGFEIYYKLFPASVTAPPSAFNSVEDMLLASYHRLNNSGEGQNNPSTNKDVPGSLKLPLIRASVFVLGAAVSKVIVDFSNMADTLQQYPKVTVLDEVDSTTFEIVGARRSVASLTEFKRFTEFATEDVAASDSDVTSEVSSEISSGTAVWVACFAASWGFDPGTASVVYSIPVLLGYESIVFPHL